MSFTPRRIVDRVYLISLSRLCREKGVQPADAHRRACSRVYGYLVWAIAAAVLFAMVVVRASAGQGYSFSNDEIRAGQFAAAILIGVALVAIERRLRFFAGIPPAPVAEESPGDRRFLLGIRLASIGSFVLVVGAGILLRVLGG